MDFPVRPQNRAALKELTRAFERLSLERGGRFYFAKDSVLSSEAWRQSVGPEAVERFFALKARVDPQDLLGGNLYRRVIKPLRGVASPGGENEPVQEDEGPEPASLEPALADAERG